MKILTNCTLPFSLAHGGWAMQIEATGKALQGLGVEVEPVRWWDGTQRGDIIHFFGRMSAEQIRFAHKKSMKVVMAELLTATGSRSARQLFVQKQITRGLKRLAPRSLVAAFNWDSYRLADAVIALTPWEKHLMEYLFDADPARTFVVPNGVETCFFESPPLPRGSWLVCTATITGRKRVLELAQAAVAAKVPLWVVGRPYADDDPYAQKFFQLAKQEPNTVRYEGAVNDRTQLAAIYRAAHGFVLLSAEESLSLSALEAAACGCPLLLSDLPWARGSFAGGAQFCPVTDSVQVTAGALRQFYDTAPGLPPPSKPATWAEVGRELIAIYEKVLRQN
jgi:glycosyltransferase involved in cell wall biosynthesis